MYFVIQRLKKGRAITLCCRAKTVRSAALMATAASQVPSTPVSIDFGTATLPMKPMA